MDGRPPFLEFFLRQGFTLAETHISWVLLGESDVYKIKKCVNLGFLDYGSRARRRAACEAELSLNRRLAPGIYLEVVAIVPRGAGWALVPPTAGEEPEEWAVHMARLPEACRADCLLAAGRLDADQLDQLATTLARFHAGARCDQETARYGRLEVVRQNVAENFAQGRASLARTLSPEEGAELERWQLAFLADKAALFAAREEAGRVRDGHGDLRLEHVYFLPEAEGSSRVVVVDCIEFNQRFRFADVAADVAFLAMDLTQKGRPELAEVFLAAYAREADDFGLYGVVDFYESYRAHVRAKIAGFVADDDQASEKTRALAEGEARRYYLLALASERRSLLPPRLVAIGGNIACGKSTLAQTLGRTLGAPVVEADHTRKILLGVAPEKKVHELPWQGAYSPDWTQKVYRELRDRAQTILLSGRTAIVDASFRSRAERKAMRELAVELGVPFLFLECRADPATCKKRLAQRAQEQSTSDGRLEIFDQLAAAWERVDELPATEYRVLETSRPSEDLVQELIQGNALGYNNKAIRAV